MRQLRASVLLGLVFAAIVCPRAHADETIRICSWNAHNMNGPQEVKRRSKDIREFIAAVKADVILLQEVTGLAAVEALRDEAGWKNGAAACSDFTQPDDEGPSSFEVGIISRFPLDNVLEYDVTLDGNRIRKGAPEETRLISAAPWKPRDPEGIRGYLYAEVRGKNIGLITVHLKSSRGRSGRPDDFNAKLREFVAASAAETIAKRVSQKPAFSFLVGGDFNVGATDKNKLGHDLYEDSFEPRTSGKDGYDDTYAYFENGLKEGGGIRMTNLTKNVGETFDSRNFPGTGPIDNLLGLHGRKAANHSFGKGAKGAKTFGSDHFPVYVDLTIKTDAARAAKK
jgi:endonuclease/exonuclease/phosphatase family metal-dependent hydrolase